eukprot:gene2589-3550_t
MSEFEQFVNITRIVHLPSGGIGTTIWVNTILCSLMFLAFVTCVIWLPPFDLKKKKRYQQQYEKQLKHSKKEIDYKESAIDSGEAPIYHVQKKTIKDKIKRFFYVLITSISTFVPCLRFGEFFFEDVNSIYGTEVGVYLLFQKYMIIAIFTLSVIALPILLPIHLTGNPPVFIYGTNNATNLTQEQSNLLKTSVTMVVNTPWKLYFHVGLSFVFAFIIVSMICLFYYKSTTWLKPEEDISSYSVQIYDLPSDLLDSELEVILESLYPNNEITSCEILYNVSEGLKINKKLQNCKELLDHYTYLNTDPEDPPKAFCVDFNIMVDAVEHYTTKYENLKEELNEWNLEYKKALNGEFSRVKSTRKAHIIFRSMEDAENCLKQNNIVQQIKRVISKKSEEKKTLTSGDHTFEFKVKKAIDPSDISWINYLTHRYINIIRELIAHGIILIILIFFTTPISVVTALQSIGSLPYIQQGIYFITMQSGQLGNFFFQYIPTLTVLIYSTFLVEIVKFITGFAKYRTNSKFSRMVMFRMFIYLTLSVFILPTLLLGSADGVVQYFKSSGDIEKMFKLMFMPFSGSFFINLLLQMALLKNFESLVMIKDLVFYAFLWAISTTPKKNLEAAESIDFKMSTDYSFMCVILCITLCYSLFTPVILPCAFFYFFIKFFIDRLLIGVIMGSKLKLKKKSDDNVVIMKKTWLVMKMTIWVLLGFILFQIFFYAFKISASNLLYISHMVLEIFLFLIVLFFYIALFSFKSLQSFTKKTLPRNLKSSVNLEKYSKGFIYRPKLDFVE